EELIASFAQGPLPEFLAFEFSPSKGNPAKAAKAQSTTALTLAQAHLSSEAPEGARLAFLSQGAVPARPGEAPDPATASAWGLIRSAQSEHPGRFALIDHDGSDASINALPAAIAHSATEPQIALRGGEARAPRLARVEDAPAAPWRLDIKRRGTLENLTLVECPEVEAPLGPEEVRLAVRAGGLNFRDVLLALDMVSVDQPLGGEGAGVVLEVGPEVDDLAPGDRVVGLFTGAFGPTAIADHRLLAPLPSDWSFVQGAAVPVCALTARYGLFDLAGLEAGERVLIHSAAGGVGLMAVQQALDAGAEVFATAHPSKWEALRELGLDEAHIASSRDLEFRERFAEALGEGDIDVVLNSLAERFVDASLELLGEGGRFVEMGKTDIREAEGIAARHPGVSYRAFDLPEAGPDRLGEMLRQLKADFERGALRHSPVTTWDARRGAEAFRFMSQARHVGKIVLTLPAPPNPKATTLITGATGTLGALTARHLVKAHGARHLLLISRRGEKAPGARELQAELKELGAKVRIAACDVADRKALKALLGEIPKEHPLGAIYHAAGAIDDALLTSLDPKRIE
ncbi:MAG TPA: SDR family NAD(P)-dependent oxidoreductase, partial [Solirubrobacterales bacterium]|nr:SDR family NAD(P)-dependent oxidoreductase [Solirubrobacterales bacterium]